MTVEASTSLKPEPNAASSPGPLSTVGRALRNAAQSTGASFEYLLATAKAESDLNPSLTMQASSATGLFQFIEQTWLSVMKGAGQALGLGDYADSIEQTAGGRYVVKDSALRQEILTLRQDPNANAVLAGAFTQQNAELLAKRLGKAPSDAELYIAHFFGPSAAAKLIRTAGADPTANAASMFPPAARANRPIFYDQQGNARSVSGVYAELTRRYQAARASPTPKPTLAFAASSMAAPLATLPVPDTAGVTQALAAARSLSPDRPQNSGPVFHSLFSSEARRGPLAPVVSQLWGAEPVHAPAPAAAPAAVANASGATPLDLFRDRQPNVRSLFGVTD